MGALHRKQTSSQGLHSAVVDVFANESARLILSGAMFSGAVVENEGGIYKQADNSTYWILDSYSPPVWVEISNSGTAFVPSITAGPYGTTQNNLNPTGMSDVSRQTLFISSSANINITGIASGSEGRPLNVINIGDTFGFTLLHENAGSTDVNRIIGPQGSNIYIPPGSGFELVYRTNRWVSVRGNSSPLNLGTGSNTVAAGDDPRFLKNGEGYDDVWVDYEPHRTTTLHQGPWVLVAVAAGVLTGWTITDDMQEGRNVIATLRSAAGANSGYRWYTENQNYVLFSGSNQQEYVFVSRIWLPGLTSRLIRFGFHDTASTTAPVDGVYFQFESSSFTGKASSNSVVSTTSTSYTPLTNSWYTCIVRTITSSTPSAYFEIREDTQGLGLVWSGSVTTNLPALVARATGPGFIGTYGPAVATNIVALAYLGFGTSASWVRKTQGA